MTTNIGTAGRIGRALLGIAFFAFAWWQQSWLAFAFGLFTLFEALFSWCILRALLGKPSCPIETPNPHTTKEIAMIDSRRLGLAGGILWGLSMFGMTLLTLFTGYGKEWLELMATVYPGYQLSWSGAIVGLVYGFIDGFIGLFLLGWLYNRLGSHRAD